MLRGGGCGDSAGVVSMLWDGTDGALMGYGWVMWRVCCRSGPGLGLGLAVACAVDCGSLLCLTHPL